MNYSKLLFYNNTAEIAYFRQERGVKPLQFSRADLLRRRHSMPGLRDQQNLGRRAWVLPITCYRPCVHLQERHPTTTGSFTISKSHQSIARLASGLDPEGLKDRTLGLSARGEDRLYINLIKLSCGTFKVLSSSMSEVPFCFHCSVRISI
jgi:hypothetical protein